MSTTHLGLKEPNLIVQTKKDLVAQLAANRCSLLHKAYLKELSLVTDKQAESLSFAMEGSYEELTSMEAHLIEKYLNKPVRGRNPEFLSEVTKGPVGGVRIWNCDGHIIYTPVGFRIVFDPVIQTKADRKYKQANVVPEHRPCHDEDCDLCLQFLARQQSINDKLAKLASEAARDTDFRHLIAEKEQQCADLEKATVKVMEVMSKRIEELTKALEKKHVELHSKNRKRVDVTKMPLAEHDAYEVKLAQSFQILHEILPTVEPVNVDLRHVLYNEAVPPPATSVSMKAPVKTLTEDRTKKLAKTAKSSVKTPNAANPLLSKGFGLSQHLNAQVEGTYGALNNEINTMLKNTSITMEDLKRANDEMNKHHKLCKNLLTHSDPAYVAHKSNIPESDELREFMRECNLDNQDMRSVYFQVQKTGQSPPDILKRSFPNVKRFQNNKSSSSSKTD